MAGGVALANLAHDRPLLQTVGLGLLALGIVAGIVGYRRYRSADQDIRASRLPAPGHGPALLTVGVIGVAMILIFAYLIA
jgi:putative membrane protein